MRRILSAAAAVCFVGLATLAAIAAQGPQAPQRGPEVQRLGSIVGTWQDETEIKQTPFSPAGKETGTSTCEWFTGNFQVICRGEGTGPAGKTSSMIVVGWHPGEKAYFAQVIDSQGGIGQLIGSVAGNTWTLTSTREVAPPDPKFGKAGKVRITIVEESPTLQTSKFEISVDGGPWTLVTEGRSTKVK